MGSCAFEEEEEEDEGRKREGTGAERRRGSHSGGLRGAPLSAARRHSGALLLIAVLKNAMQIARALLT